MQSEQNKKIPEIWALLDDVAGHNTQVLGVAEAIGLPFHKKKLAYNKKAWRPNLLKLNGLDTIDRKKSDMISKPWPDIIISCGRKAASIASAIKKQAKKDGTKVFAVHILWPGMAIDNFDMIAVPFHDNISWMFRHNRRLFRFLGSPNRITADFLNNEYTIWARTIGELPLPRIAVLVGGNAKNSVFNENHAKVLINNIVDICSALKSAVLVTTSRRTDEQLCAYMEGELKKRIGRYLSFHDYHKTKANPFYAYMKLADIIIVTGDSISMISESCSTGKPVYIYAPEGNAPEKHRKFHEKLYSLGHAKKFNGEAIKAIIDNGISEKAEPYKSLNSASDIAQEIITRSRLF